jgi:hypothetical protein
MLPFLPLLQYVKPALAAKPVSVSEKTAFSPHVPEVLPDSLEHEAYDEEHNLVLH